MLDIASEALAKKARFYSGQKKKRLSLTFDGLRNPIQIQYRLDMMTHQKMLFFSDFFLQTKRRIETAQ